MLTTPEESDPEVPRAIKAIKLQHDLSVLFDQDGHDHFIAHFETQPNSESDFNRLKELRGETFSSKLLWTADPLSRLTLDSETFIAAIRLRLGASFTCQPIRCRLCNRTLDINGSRALCCAPGEGTRGHKDIRDEVFQVTKMVDATAKREVFGIAWYCAGPSPF